MKHVFFYDFPIGTLGIASESDKISHVVFGNKKDFSDYKVAETSTIQQAAKQLTEYFNGQRIEFDLPLALNGTDFQLSVWQALQTIPYGETKSYKDIATLIGNPKASRAVGMANNRNPISIIIPCHRVIGHDGSMTGYGGGLPIKEYLLKLEKDLLSI